MVMGKVSGKKKDIGKISKPGRAEWEKRGLTSEATPLSVILTGAFVAVVTFIVFLPALQNEFVNWDDDIYVYENSLIRSLDIQLFTSSFLGFHAANWHPLTWISHALDYAIWGLNPLGHHLTNNILHALNSLLVVFLVMRLIAVHGKIAGNGVTSQSSSNDRTIMITGVVTGLLFGLHPLHVESVAWVAERKDLLCAFFFLASIIAYTHYASEINEAAKKKATSRFFDEKYLFTLGSFDKAMADYEKAIALNPLDSEAYNNRGVAFAKIGQLDKAIADFDKAIALNPSLSEAYLNRGRTHLMTNNKESAVSDLKKACTLGSERGCKTLQTLR